MEKIKSKKIKKKKNKWKVEFSKEFLNKIEDIPNEVGEELEKIIIGFKTGKLDPTKIGNPIEWIELDIRLKCPECESNNIQWLLDRNSNEVTFRCLKCSEGFWMTYKEYKDTIKRNPQNII